jgi:putative thioredoxin
VQSIPMVVAVVGGQLVDGFLGAMPEAQVRQWISQVLAAAEKMGMALAEPAIADEAEDEGHEDDVQPGANGTTPTTPTTPVTAAAPPGAPGAPGAPGGPPGGYGPGAPQVPPAYAEARAAMERGDLDAAARAFEGELARSPGDPVAKTGLAQVNLIRRISSYDQAKVRKEAAQHPDDVQAQSQVADIDLASGRVEEAFDRMLGVVRRTSGAERDQARAHLVSLFELLPPRDPHVTKARSALSALLF